MSPAAFAPEEVEKMRAFVQAHDMANPQRIKEFDLNNPPVPPYRHQEYPLHMTNKEGKVAVANDEKSAAKLAKGGYMKPAEYRAHTVSLAPSAEAEE